MMLSSVILSGLLSSVLAQIPIPQNSEAQANNVNDPSNPANYQQQTWTPPVAQPVAQPVVQPVVQPVAPPAAAAHPPPPLLASEFIHSGQLPSYNPGYISNAQGYFVPVYIDAEEELPEDFAKKLVDPSQLDVLLNNPAGAAPARGPDSQQQAN